MPKETMLSPSTVGDFAKCPKCFWLAKNMKLNKPRGIFPSLPGGMDLIIKTYMDRFRERAAMPPELAELETFGNRLFRDQANLDLWRNWRTGLRYHGDGFYLTGALDDLLVTAAGLHVPFDYKTKGSPANAEDTVKYYQNQTNLYGLMLWANEMKVSDYAIFSYWSPSEVRYNSLDPGIVKFTAQVIRIPMSPDAGRDLVERAYACLQGTMPRPSDDCEYCEFVKQRQTVNA